MVAAKMHEPDSLDFVFIDGDHSTEAVTADIEAWLPKLKPDGVLAGHDAARESVRSGVRSRLGKKWHRIGSSWIMD